MTDEQTISLAYEPRAPQRLIHELMAKKRFVVAVCHRRMGKSHAGAAAVSMAALARPGTHYSVVLPHLKQGLAVFWPIFRKILATIPSVDFKTGENKVVLPNQSTVTFFSGEQHDSIRGVGLDGVLIDEIAQIPFDAWFSSIRPTLAGTGGWALLTGTPRGADLLLELYQYAENGADAQWGAILLPASETGVLPSDELDAARREAATPTTFLREYECDLTVSDENAICPLQDVIASQKPMPNNLSRDTLNHEAKVMGIDLGGGEAGGDRSVIALRWGRYLIDPVEIPAEEHEGLPWRVIALVREFRPQAIHIDATGGWATGLLQVLQNTDLRVPVIPVNFASRAGDEQRWHNKRAEMYGEMARWMKRPDTRIPKGQKLASELSTTTFKHDSRGRVQLERKTDVKARLGRSPDIADAVALTFAVPVFTPEQINPPVFSSRPPGQDRYSDELYQMKHGRPGARGPYTEFDPWTA